MGPGLALPIAAFPPMLMRVCACYQKGTAVTVFAHPKGAGIVFEAGAGSGSGVGSGPELQGARGIPGAARARRAAGRRGLGRRARKPADCFGRLQLVCDCVSMEIYHRDISGRACETRTFKPRHSEN